MKKTTLIEQKKQVEKRESARIRKAKSRLLAKENNMERVRLDMGTSDYNALKDFARAAKQDLSAYVTQMVMEHVQEGKWVNPTWVGTCWESQPTEAEITVSKEVHEHLCRYAGKKDEAGLTAGDVVSLLLGIKLAPEWDDDEPFLVGKSPNGDRYRMIGFYESAWHFKEHWFQGMLAQGRVDEAKARWPNRDAQLESAKRKAKAGWLKTHTELDNTPYQPWIPNNQRVMKSHREPTRYFAKELYPGEDNQPIVPVERHPYRGPVQRPRWKEDEETGELEWVES